MNHIGLVKLNIDNTRIEKIQYLESKWDRELGDTMTINGERFKVGVIGETRNSVITTLNGLIKTQNSYVRRQNKIANRKADLEFAKITNKIFKDLNII
jgi:hypothetical protein